MADLRERFDQLGLSQYLEAFVAEGFDSWKSVLDVTETDLDSLRVKLGHRRKLQRAITEWITEHKIPPLKLEKRRASVDGSYRSDESDNDAKTARKGDVTTTTATQSTKRKYRRHPKPDEHAPERPPSAYVIFSNQVRETLKGQDRSFAEIAKIVGERWQVLSPASREACDKQAATAKEKYYQELSEYKKTQEYANYQLYLTEFKAKYNLNPVGREEGKRSKLESESSMSSVQTAPRGSDRMGHVGQRNDNAACYEGHRRDLSVEYFDTPAAHHRYNAMAMTSSTNRPFTSVNSPHVQEQFSPTSMSPNPTSTYREAPPFLPVTQAYDPRERQMGLSRGSPAYLPTAVSSPPPPYNPYDTAQDLRHPRRDPPELKRAGSSLPSVPSLTHTDTSASGHSQMSRQSSVAGGVPTLPPLPLPDGSKAHRILPQPIPTPTALVHSPLETTPSSAGLPTRLASPGVPPSERRSGLDALLIATELVGNTHRAPPPSDDRPP